MAMLPSRSPSRTAPTDPGSTVKPGEAARSGLTAEVCRTNRPLRLTQAELERRTDWGGAPGAGLPLRGFLGVPLVGHGGRNLGLIQLSDRIEGDFDAGDERVLTSLAQFTAMAIEQLRLHADLAYQSQLTLTVTENATSGLFLMDPQLRVTYMNSAGREIIGHSLADLGDRPFHDVVHHSRPDGTPLPMAECRIWRAVIGEQTNLEPFEDWFIRPDGTFYPVRIAAAPINRDDRVVSVVARGPGHHRGTCRGPPVTGPGAVGVRPGGQAARAHRIDRRPGRGGGPGWRRCRS